MSKVTINTEWLSDCGGCHVAVVDLHEKLLQVLGSVELLHFPVLTDIKDYPQAEVGLLSGAIRSEHDRHAAEAMRKACKKLIAFGTCAVYGGISGATMAHSREELIHSAFGQGPSTKAGAGPTRDVAPLEKLVTPIDEVVKVDLYLPGCPPHAAFIFDAIISLVEGRSPKAKSESVCGSCRRSMVKTDQDVLRGRHEAACDTSKCLLSQGIVCLGSVSLDRCLAPCPEKGVACTGCAGPTMQILTEPNRDVRTEVADRMARLTKIPGETIVKAIEAAAKTHYAYAMASRMVSQKPTFLIKKWIADTEAQ